MRRCLEQLKTWLKCCGAEAITTITLWSILIIMGLDLNGCKRIEYDNIATTILEEKYGEKFEVKEVNRQYLFDQYYTVMAYPTDNPHILFNAAINYIGKGCNDNYYGKIFFDKFSDRIEKNLDSLDGVYYVYSEGFIEDIGFESEEVDFQVICLTNF